MEQLDDLKHNATLTNRAIAYLTTCNAFMKSSVPNCRNDSVSSMKTGEDGRRYLPLRDVVVLVSESV